MWRNGSLDALLKRSPERAPVGSSPTASAIRHKHNSNAPSYAGENHLQYLGVDLF